ncbi:XRE family transcriptional regulator [Campylobacter pinnipediorum]|uniref:XRE family transcriptional regulator n=1 Tax=Campylobacter pinnipediorum TaxID=1965231 RepID=UPI00084D7EEA|nr:LexA family transcriptional regulator [Campylobacter pinnipediorum]AQW83350.1 transcriptional regulator, XRE family (peptidase S24 LexA-like domain) [Campylobacter pinnipediorum subsp. pinnipediorum]OPA75408.1 transcriptional regulator [Campylobacter pinnipediorum subsp. pinnipediorum]
MKLGLRIKNLREERGLTQIELANLSGISRASIQLYEADKVEIPVKKLSDISKALNVDTDFFIKEKSSLVVRKYDQDLVRKSFVSNSNLKEENSKNNVPQNVPEKNKIMSRNVDFLSPNANKLKKSQIEQIQNDQIYIRQLSSSVGAGESVDIDGLEIYDTDVLIPFSRMLFKLNPDEERLRCMRVDGYSMIPMLYPDSWVIADITKKFTGDGLYIINYCGNFMVKLLQKAPNGILHINSVNKDYQSYEINEDSQTEVTIVGKVLRCVI